MKTPESAMPPSKKSNVESDFASEVVLAAFAISTRTIVLN